MYIEKDSNGRIIIQSLSWLDAYLIRDALTTLLNEGKQVPKSELRIKELIKELNQII